MIKKVVNNEKTKELADLLFQGGVPFSVRYEKVFETTCAVFEFDFPLVSKMDPRWLKELDSFPQVDDKVTFCIENIDGKFNVYIQFTDDCEDVFQLVRHCDFHDQAVSCIDYLKRNIADAEIVDIP